MNRTMGAALSGEERVRRALAGDTLDHPPYSFWTHFPGTDLDPDALVETTIGFARELKLDFVKAMSNGMYCVEDWGVVSDYSDIAQGGAAKVVSTPVVAAADWGRIGRLPANAPALGRELRHLQGLVKAFSPGTPVLATVFSPLTIAHKIGGKALARDLREAPARVLAALENIARTTADFARATLEAGCAGIFFAVQDADPREVDDASYAKFGEAFDRIVLEAAGAGWFNVVHMHGDRILFDRLKSYPVAALNWHIGEAEPTLAAYRKSGGNKPIVGGLRRMGLTRRDMNSVNTDLAQLAGDEGILISPGCVIRHPVDTDFLKTVIGKITKSQ